jgi:hypothetical protein
VSCGFACDGALRLDLGRIDRAAGSRKTSESRDPRSTGEKEKMS